MHAADPVTLYIITQPGDKARLRPLVRILVNMIVRLLADKLDFIDGRPVANYKHRLLMMLDEFPSLGKLEIMQESLAFVAGYGIKCYLICQDINQLKSRETGYGHDESISSNCHIQNAYPPNRVETAEHLSRLTGQTTIVKEQITTSGRRTAAMLGQVSRTYQEVQRPLLTPDECLRMPGPRKNSRDEIEEAGDMVIYVAGYPAIYGKQPLYFKDAVFQARASIPAPKVSDKLVPAGKEIKI
jgi:type IV secretion system protein VirD4